MNRLNILFLVCNILLFIFFIGGHNRNNETKQAFEECIEEVSNNCKALISYATALESENAKLNRKLRMLNESR